MDTLATTNTATSLATTLTVPFAAGFVVQRFLEILDPITIKLIKNPNTKKIVLGLVSLGIGFALAAGMKLEMFHQLLGNNSTDSLTIWLDYFATAIFVSGGTEGFNSLLKFANYKKESAAKASTTGQQPKALPEAPPAPVQLRA